MALTSCTASGRPCAPLPHGTVTQGTPKSVHARLNTGSPVLASEAGASPGALGVGRKSTTRIASASARLQRPAGPRIASDAAAVSLQPSTSPALHVAPQFFR